MQKYAAKSYVKGDEVPTLAFKAEQEAIARYFTEVIIESFARFSIAERDLRSVYKVTLGQQDIDILII